MSYVIYHCDTTEIFRHPRDYVSSYETELGAKIARGRFALDPDIWLIADQRVFSTLIEKHETKVNLITGTKFSQSVNTPLSCDPSSETYWSM